MLYCGVFCFWLKGRQTSATLEIYAGQTSPEKEEHMEEVTTNTVEQAQTSDSFLAGWDEETTSASAADQPEEADVAERDEETASAVEQGEPLAEEGGSGTGEETVGDSTEGQVQTATEQPKTWTLHHLDEARTVNEADMVVLAQKGMDYDRIRGKYDEAKPVMELFTGFAQKAGMSVAEYVSYIRTQAKQQGGMSEAEAKRTVDLEDREAAVAAKEAAQSQAAATQNSAEVRRRADILEFQKTFPDVAKDPKTIPPEVWVEVNNGASLTIAYAKYALAQAKAAQKTAEQKTEAVTQNHKNAARATGSMRTAGDSTKSKDPFMEGFGG